MFAGKLCEQQNEWNLMLMVSLSVALWHSPCLSTLFHSNPCVLCAVPPLEHLRSGCCQREGVMMESYVPFLQAGARICPLHC